MEQYKVNLEEFTTSINLIHPQLIPVIQMLFSSVGVTVFLLFAKLLTRLKSPQVVFYRSFVMLCINTLMIWHDKVEVYTFSKVVKYQLISRGIFGAIGASFLFEGLRFITLSESIVLMRTSPLWTLLFLVFVSKQEKFSIKSFLTIFIGFIGVMFVTRPPQITPLLREMRLINYEEETKSDPLYLYGVILTIFGAMSISMIQIVTSSLVKSTSNLAVIQYNTFIQLVCGVLTSYFYGDGYNFIQINFNEFLIILAMGVVSFASQYLQNRAMVKGKLTLMSSLTQTSVIWALLIDVTIMHADPHICGVLGSFIIVGSLLVLAFEKSKPTQAKPSVVLSHISI